MLIAELLESEKRYKRRDFEHRQKIVALENEILYLNRVEGSRKRETYPKDHPREHGGKGRIMIECRDCKKHRPQHAHKLCRKCYDRWYYSKFAREKRLGSKRLTYKEYKQVVKRDADGKRCFEDAVAVAGLRRKGLIPFKVE